MGITDAVHVRPGVATIVASLVMATRVSVKVRLAWSTCAQMGFMLVECALGLCRLALLHILAHSLYKAHAFLTSGTAVNHWRKHGDANKTAFGLSRWLGALVLSVAGALAGAIVVRTVSGSNDSLGGTRIAVLLVLMLGLVPFGMGTHVSAKTASVRAFMVLAVSALYFTIHDVAALAFSPPAFVQSQPIGEYLTAAGMVVLFGTHWLLRLYPDSAWARALYPRLFAGFYPDEWFTRVTFRIWPAPLSQSQTPISLPLQERTLEA